MTRADQPLVVIVAGPNGAGKSTTAQYLLRDALAVTEFVNADGIAAGLSVFYPERVAMTAGRVMLQRLRALAAARQDFAFETTLASRSFAPWLAELRGGALTRGRFLTTPGWASHAWSLQERSASRPGSSRGPSGITFRSIGHEYRAV